MKKILSLFLTILLAIAPMSTVLAADDSLEVTQAHAGYSFTITAKTNFNASATLKVFPIAAEGAEIAPTAVPTYIAQLDAPTGTDATSGKNVYTFAFDFATGTATGWYRAIVNNETAKAVDFKYYDAADIVSFYQSLKAANTDTDIVAVFEAYKDSAITFDMGGYFDPVAPYGTEVKEKIAACINALDASLPADLGALPTHTQVNNYLAAYETVLLPEKERVITIAEIETAASATEFDTLIQANDVALGLDMGYYDNATIGLTAEAVYNRAKAIPSADFTNAKVAEKFNVAVMLAMIDTVEYGTVTAALQHYNGNGFTLSSTYSAGFGEAEHNSVSVLLKNNASSITSAATLEAKYLEYSEDVLRGDVNNGTQVPGLTPSNQGSIGGGSRPSGPSKPTGTFSDINDAPWAKEAIEYLATENVLAGKGDGKFYPNDTVTREEFVKIIVEAFDLLEKNATANFADIEEGRWSYSHIASAFSAGIITGDGSNFNPSSQMTRQDMAVVIYRVAQHMGETLPGTPDSSFADQVRIADYAQEAVGVLVGAGIINGTGDNMFTPSGIVTRAQAAKIVYELIMVIK